MVSKRNSVACCSDMLMTFRDDAIIALLVPFCQPLRLKQHHCFCVHKQRIYSNSILFFKNSLFSVFPFHPLDFFPSKIWCGASKANILILYISVISNLNQMSKICIRNKLTSFNSQKGISQIITKALLQIRVICTFQFKF